MDEITIIHKPNALHFYKAFFILCFFIMAMSILTFYDFSVGYLIFLFFWILCFLYFLFLFANNKEGKECKINFRTNEIFFDSLSIVFESIKFDRHNRIIFKGKSKEIVLKASWMNSADVSKIRDRIRS